MSGTALREVIRGTVEHDVTVRGALRYMYGIYVVRLIYM